MRTESIHIFTSTIPTLQSGIQEADFSKVSVPNALCAITLQLKQSKPTRLERWWYDITTSLFAKLLVFSLVSCCTVNHKKKGTVATLMSHKRCKTYSRLTQNTFL